MKTPIEDLTDKVLKGTQAAIKKLVEQRRREGGYLVISVNGKPTKVPAKDIKL